MIRRLSTTSYAVTLDAPWQSFRTRLSWQQSGFTLVEIMVVVVLIALSATFAVVNLQRDADQIAELEARRFAQLIKQVREESILSGRRYAVAINDKDNTYRFLIHRNEWMPVEHDELLRPRRFPSDLKVSFTLPGAPTGQELLIVDEIGEMTAFELALSGASNRYIVSLDTNQQVVVGEMSDGS